MTRKRSKPAPTKRKKVWRLTTLVRGIPKRNRHGEVDWGGPVGKEIW